MDKNQPSQWLQWICASNDSDELRQNYDQWATSYETDIAAVWHVVPPNAALMLATYLENKQGMVLDIGAGTGLVGVELAKLGFEHLIGLDISPEMLAQAAKKKVYRSLSCCSIGDKDFAALGKATGMIATGVFAESHAGEAELKSLQSQIETEGILVFTARESFLPKLQTVLSQPEWTFLDSKVLPIYEDPMHLLAYRISS